MYCYRNRVNAEINPNPSPRTIVYAAYIFTREVNRVCHMRDLLAV